MPVPVAVDLTRLAFGLLRPTPRGIDRVELSYGEHFLSQWPGESLAVTTTPWGTFTCHRQDGLRLLSLVAQSWGECDDPQTDASLARVKSWLSGAPFEQPSPARLRAQGTAHPAALPSFLEILLKQRRNARRGLPPRSVVFNVGQIGLAVPRLLHWHARRPDVSPVFMLHDVIPIEFPEFVPASSEHFHRGMLQSTARYAKALVVPTKAAGKAIRAELLRFGRAQIEVAAVPLPASTPFNTPAASARDLAAPPYFVMCGAIERRKNHLLILNIWRELAKSGGPGTPKLVIAGSRWNTDRSVDEMLRRCPAIRGHVLEVANLSTPALKHLITGARALLMPSFAEGFGLPIVEALACRTPVLASNIAAHREAGGPFPTYLDPLDGPGWLEAIRAHSLGTAFNTTARLSLQSYRPRTWRDYFRDIDAFVDGLTGEVRASRQQPALPLRVAI